MEKAQMYDEVREQTGLSILYSPRQDGTIVVEAVSDTAPVIRAQFTHTSLDEAHILYMEATELLHARAVLQESPASIRIVVDKLFAAFRGEKVSFENASATVKPRLPSGEFIANPGKKLEIDVDGVTYTRLPVRTRLLTMKDTDILPIIEDYVGPYLQSGDLIFVSEKALTVTQGRIVDLGDIKATKFARLLARNVGNNYGSNNFQGFGHGTALAMQLFLEEAGYPRLIFAAAVSALTRPFGIRGMFYRICGKRAKSVDCPMSFLILEYAHAAKLAPNDPNGAARRIRQRLGAETIILDANYRGAFSLGKSTRGISESFIQKLFRDNPLGQSDEMTPFCIVRKVPVGV
jgi:hypothetical protein